jgi:hypothetical protein
MSHKWDPDSETCPQASNQPYHECMGQPRAFWDELKCGGAGCVWGGGEREKDRDRERERERESVDWIGNPH